MSSLISATADLISLKAIFGWEPRSSAIFRLLKTASEPCLNWQGAYFKPITASVTVSRSQAEGANPASDHREIHPLQNRTFLKRENSNLKKREI
ncbi:unnamed protein product [Oikopleura dioica]|uniref:Uncharacterized protein n=1 Tax=Oikopleura dioica TaxID=34765 RepID=E4XJL9_OIKDI|nr:unnamed protein product [Oikopleura dioica]